MPPIYLPQRCPNTLFDSPLQRRRSWRTDLALPVLGIGRNELNSGVSVPPPVSSSGGVWARVHGG